MNSVVPFGSFVTRDITIPINSTDSNKISLDGMTLVGIGFPAMSGTQVHLYTSDALDGTYFNVFTALGATQLTMTVGAAARFISLNPNSETTGIKFLQLQAATTQVAARTIKLFLKGI